MLGAPGAITAPRTELAQRFFGIDPSGDPPVITWFMEGLELDQSSNHPEAAKSLPDQILDAPTAVVALFDERKKVVDVLQLPVISPDVGPTPGPVSAMKFGVETYTIGFVQPPGVDSFLISVGGAE